MPLLNAATGAVPAYPPVRSAAYKIPRFHPASDLMFVRKSYLMMATAVAAALLFSASTSLAGSPRVDRISPTGLQRGTEIKITLTGSNMGDATSLKFPEPTIHFKSFETVEPKKLVAVLTTDAETKPGLYPFFVETKTGLSNLRLLAVGTMPSVPEAEPNNDFASPQPIEINQTVEGVVQREDIDHYRVKVAAGQRINVEIEGLRLHFTPNNQNILDPYIAILDSQRFEMAASDDATLWQQDGFCSYLAEEDCELTILVRDSAFGGSPLSGYRLHVGTFPRPMVVVPGGGRPGQTLSATMVNFDGTTSKLDVPLPNEPVDNFPIFAETESGVSPSPNYVRVVDLPTALEEEPNDSMNEPSAMPTPAAAAGVLSDGDPADYFKFVAAKNTTYRVQAFGRQTLRSKADLRIDVYGPDKRRIGGADDVGNQPDPFYQFKAGVEGDHYIRVSDHLRSGSPLHVYRVEVTPAKPEVTLTSKELRRDESFYPVTPQGGVGAFMVTAARRDYGGEIPITVEGLPNGVTAKTFPIPAGRTEIPVLLTAADDAPMGAHRIAVASGSDGFESRYQQTHKLVLGQNRRSLWNQELDHTYMVVSDPLPFTIELEQPATPIVRQGSKDLKLKLTRNEGFKDVVYLRSMYNPPGIAVNNSRRFEKDNLELDIPITANGGAAVGKWPIVLVARYNTPTGPVETVGGHIELDVQTQLFSFEFPNASGTQGGTTSIAIKYKSLKELPGEATLQLVGLPKGVTTQTDTLPIDPAGDSITFPIDIAADAKPTLHKTLNVIARVVVKDGERSETITQTVGTGSIRVNKPAPPKKQPASPEKNAAEKAKPAEKPAEKAPEVKKPLSRLEQLRQQKGS